jgi:putative ABC transport system ATP-binding protein
MIIMKQVRKSYFLGQEELKALDEIDFTVKKGEFVSIVGPSGSRKINTYEHAWAIRYTR